MFTTYILRSEASGKFYIGQTNDLAKRLIRHNTGQSAYTKNKGPWVVVFSKNFQTRAEAMKLEKLIKSYKKGNSFFELIKQSTTPGQQ